MKCGLFLFVGAVISVRGLGAQDLMPQEAVLFAEIGDVDGETTFSWIEDVTADPAGRVYVLESYRVSVFSQGGTPIRQIGREGAGPGEFRSAISMGWWGDDLWVADSRLDRVTVFDTTGGLVRTVSGQPTALGPYLIVSVPDRILADGSFLTQPRTDAALVVDGEVPSMPLLRIDPTEERVDTLAVLDVRHSQGGIRTGSGRVVGSFRQVYGDQTLWAMAPVGDWIVVVDRPADMPTFAVHRISMRGDTAWSRTFPGHQVNLTDDAFQATVKEMAARLTLGFLASRTQAQRERTVAEELFRPRYLPTVNAVVIGADGRIWLRREQPRDTTSPVEWLILDENGRPAARVDVPQDEILKFADAKHLYSVHADSLGVLYLHILIPQ
jgi:hypothetical protein